MLWSLISVGGHFAVTGRSKLVHLEHQVNWITVCDAIQALPSVIYCGLLTILLRFELASVHAS